MIADSHIHVMRPIAAPSEPYVAVVLAKSDRYLDYSAERRRRSLP
jgi:hypothetical protein